MYRQASKHLLAAAPADVCGLLWAWGRIGYMPRDRLFMNQVCVYKCGEGVKHWHSCCTLPCIIFAPERLFNRAALKGHYSTHFHPQILVAKLIPDINRITPPHATPPTPPPDHLWRHQQNTPSHAPPDHHLCCPSPLLSLCRSKSSPGVHLIGAGCGHHSWCG